MVGNKKEERRKRGEASDRDGEGGEESEVEGEAERGGQSNYGCTWSKVGHSLAQISPSIALLVRTRSVPVDPVIASNGSQRAFLAQTSIILIDLVNHPHQSSISMSLLPSVPHDLQSNAGLFVSLVLLAFWIRRGLCRSNTYIRTMKHRGLVRTKKT